MPVLSLVVGRKGNQLIPTAVLNDLHAQSPQFVPPSFNGNRNLALATSATAAFTRLFATQ